MWRRFFQGLAFVFVAGAIASCGKTSRNHADSSDAGGTRVNAGEPECAVDLASGDGHHCAVYDDGSVWCWGRGAEGQLGDGSLEPSAVPVPTGLANIGSVAAGENHNCALDYDGSLWCWGANTDGQVGAELALEVVSSPRRVVVPSDRIQAFATSRTQTCVLDLLFHVFCWGTSSEGARSTLPVQVTTPELTPLFGLFGGDQSIFVLTADGRLFDISAWDAPITLPVGAGNRAATESESSLCVLTRTGTVWCSGGSYGPSPKFVWEFGEGVTQIAAGERFICALPGDGSVACQGANDRGQLGDGTLQTRVETAAVSGVQEAVELSAGADSACIRTSDGRVDCWGMMPDGVAAPFYVEVSRCPRPFSSPTTAPAPPPLAADRVEAAYLAYGNAMCVCAYGRASSDSADRESCIAEEAHVKSSLCLQALAPDEPYYDCRATELWDAVRCMAPSCTPETWRDCLSPNTCSQPALPGVFSYCGARMPCGFSVEPQGEGLVCDGVMDCENGLDELNCTPGQGMFHCVDGTSVASDLVCDGQMACPDGSDELGCT